MALLERIGTLLRANLNELASRAEEPVTMMKQLVLDMENQLMQVKTQVAISIADEHLLNARRSENLAKIEEWTRKAELALDKGQEALARAALERRLGLEQLVPGFDQQVADQQAQVELLKGALNKLEGKLVEARAKCDALIAQQRRARALGAAVTAATSMESSGSNRTFSRVGENVTRSAAISQARADMLEGDSEASLERMVKEDKIDRALAELKARKLPARIAAPPELS